MKRLREYETTPSPTKRMQANPIENKIEPWQSLLLEPALWGNIVGNLNTKHNFSLLSTSSFFASNINNRYQHPIMLDYIKSIFDYSHASECENFISFVDNDGNELPNKLINKQNVTQLIAHFTAQWEAVSHKIGDISLTKMMSNNLDPLEVPDVDHLAFTDAGYVGAEDEDFLDILCAAILQGNFLTFKMLKQLHPDFMARCINNRDEMNMTPFAYAAAFGRGGICSEILQLCENPFSKKIEYDLGDAFVFAMRAIHILALRSNKDFLLSILNEHAPDVFDDEYKYALGDILANDHQHLAERLQNEASLLTEIDDNGWTLVQWASCFPDSKDCLNLLLDKGATIQDEQSPPVTYLAIATGNLPALKALMAKGEQIEPFMNGNTGLHLSVYHGHSEVTEFLIKTCKLDVNAVNEMDETPAMVARNNKNYEIKLSPEQLAKRMHCVEILKANGAVDIEDNALNQDIQPDGEKILSL